MKFSAYSSSGRRGTIAKLPSSKSFLSLVPSLKLAIHRRKQRALTSPAIRSDMKHNFSDSSHEYCMRWMHVEMHVFLKPSHTMFLSQFRTERCLSFESGQCFIICQTVKAWNAYKTLLAVRLEWLNCGCGAFHGWRAEKKSNPFAKVDLLSLRFGPNVYPKAIHFSIHPQSFQELKLAETALMADFSKWENNRPLQKANKQQQHKHCFDVLEWFGGSKEAHSTSETLIKINEKSIKRKNERKENANFKRKQTIANIRYDSRNGRCSTERERLLTFVGWHTVTVEPQEHCNKLSRRLDQNNDNNNSTVVRLCQRYYRNAALLALRSLRIYKNT